MRLKANFFVVVPALCRDDGIIRFRYRPIGKRALDRRRK
jgi:hypothetical protein